MIDANDLLKTIIPFKSDPDNYMDEYIGNKPNTVRFIDWDDERFTMLNLMRNRRVYGYVEITKSTDSKNKFKRKIHHICKYEGIMIISWKHENGYNK